MQGKPNDCYILVKSEASKTRRGGYNQCASVSSFDGISWDMCILVYTWRISMEAASVTLHNESIFERYSIFNNSFKSGNSSLPQRPQLVAFIHKEVHHASEVRRHLELLDLDATSRTTGKSLQKSSLNSNPAQELASDSLHGPNACVEGS